MILDKFLQLSDKQAVTATAVSTNVVDGGATKSASIGRDIGAGTQLFLVCSVTTTFTAAGAATLVATLQDSADNATFADVLAGPAVPVAALAAGAQIVVPLPPGLRRYTRVNYTVATGPMTAGNISAHIVDGYEFRRAYPDILPPGA